ncbi:MAG: glycoside hydrolase family 65 protein, partial [Clostridia bacterium]|nr:glycoside hydrolase family 65 protein [Clostridia bacterium]
WREPLNAPNGLYAVSVFDGTELNVFKKEPASHNVSLDFRKAIYSRQTGFENAVVESERFAARDDFYLLCQKYSVTAKKDGFLEIIIGVDGDVWDINGPHYDAVELVEEDCAIGVKAVSHEKKTLVCVCSRSVPRFECERSVIKKDRGIFEKFSVAAKAGKTYTVERMSSVAASTDRADCFAFSMEKVKNADYDSVKENHTESWERAWQNAQATIEGDDEAMLALNYSMYHLMSIAPRHSSSLSIPARGLSGQTYTGAVFWDTEMFMLVLFLYTDPSVAKTILKYRIDTLPGAMEKARSYGYDGAFYAWESQEGGYDACSDYNVTDVFTGRPMRTYFRDKQIHISAAVVYALVKYTRVTGDRSLIEEGGNKVIIECARFYLDRMMSRIGSDKYELRDVIGPDEYHERVDNNGYTNRMAKFTLETAASLSETDPELKARFLDAAAKLYIPAPDENGVIEQFDGYFELEDASLDQVRSRLLHEKEYWGGAYGVASGTRIIKQADVVARLGMFPDDFDEDIMKINWEYYEPRTEHGSSLSSCMYAELACYFGQPDRAYRFFINSALADLRGGGKEWAGLIYIGGTH